MTPITAIAMSGGIDSLVSAALLKNQGHQVIGLHFITGYEEGRQDIQKHPSHNTKHIDSQTLTTARERLAPIGQSLGIPIHIIDLREPFLKLVVDYFARTYAAGKTPNPCLVCNPLIKFDILYEHARNLGAQQIATGHYAQIEQDPNGRFHLLRGSDEHKDQSYFLGRLTQLHLAAAIFPLGGLTKTATRQIARDKGLTPVHDRESQDVCFINNDNYSDFLMDYYGRRNGDDSQAAPRFNPRPGPIEDMDGHRIGEHPGLHRFTIGQRRGINLPAAAPYYVVRIEHERNCIVVGTKQDLLLPSCRVGEINWINEPPGASLTCRVRLRYRHQPVAATITKEDDGMAEVVFEQPQSAVTPGQGAVFYQNNEVLGSGWIQ